MSYQVLARKWRPSNFREMVGQEHVLKALINALDHNRLHHAYLFTGTRGVGKTTIARILAKCLNCEAGVTSTPCGECSACREISEGRFVDLIEVDAASRTKVEDTRELLDNVQYAPTRGRYKIYLIDEVHMLSNHSFNALLKTLEEPPEHVKFLLATTDPQKLPVTILSRCLQFNLKNMSPERIVGHLQHILAQEAVPFEDSSLWLLARSADGSMRDALSLTDQAIAYGSGKITEPDVAAMLGTIDHQLIQKLMSGLIAADGKKILQSIAAFAEHAPDFSAALGDLLTLLHRVAIAQALPEALDNSFGDRQQIVEFATQLSAEDVQLFYQTGLIGRRDLPMAPDPRSGFEMTLLRMLAFKPQGVVDIPVKTLQSPDSVTTEPESPADAADSAPWEEGESVKKSQTEVAITASPVMPAEPVMNGSAQEEQAASVEEPVALETSVSKRGTGQGHASEGDALTGVSAPSIDVVSDVQGDSIAAQDLKASQQGGSVSSPQAEPPVKVGVMAALVSEVEASPTQKPRDSSLADIQQQLKAQVKAITGKEGICTKPAAKEPPQVQKKAAVANRPSEQKITWDRFNSETWVLVFRQLNIKGILQSTAANCVLLGREGGHLFFALDENKGSLFDSSHTQRLAGMLSDYFGVPVKIDINLQALPQGVETPARIGEREKQELHAQALEDLANDPVVQALEREFGATIDEQSVSYE